MLERLWKKIVRRQPYSLWEIPAFLLWLGSFLYRFGFWLWRISRPTPLKLPTPVISVGNLTVGGSGKTPLVSFIARDLLAAGYRVGIVSSGYRRAVEESMLMEGYRLRSMAATTTGDEVRLLAEGLPKAWFSVDVNKTVAAQRLAESGQVDVIIIDDGFQHFGLARDVDIVAYDAGVKRRYFKAFPYGMMREPVSALKRAHIIVVTRAKLALDISRLKKRLRKLAPQAVLYHAGFVAGDVVGRRQTYPSKYLEDKSIFLFAGIGNFLAFQRQVVALAGDVDEVLELSDHQVYDAELLQHIKELADRENSDLILTTHKDWVKLGDFDFGRDIFYLDLEVDLDPGEERLLAYLQQKLGLEQRKH